MKTLTLIAVIVSAVSSLCLAQLDATGIVQGVVLDEHGQPLAGATVWAYPADRGFTHVDRSTTGLDGTFKVESLSFGKYAIGVEKPDALYSSYGFAGGDVQPLLVELTSKQPNAGVTVRFSQKVAAVELNIEDAATGEGTYSCVKLALLSDPKKWLRTRAEGTPLRVMVPANVDLTLSAWYPGYLKQTYSGSLRLQPAEVRKVRINLMSDPAAKNKSKDELLIEMKHVVEEGCADN